MADAPWLNTSASVDAPWAVNHAPDAAAPAEPTAETSELTADETALGPEYQADGEPRMASGGSKTAAIPPTIPEPEEVSPEHLSLETAHETAGSLGPTKIAAKAVSHEPLAAAELNEYTPALLYPWFARRGGAEIFRQFCGRLFVPPPGES